MKFKHKKLYVLMLVFALCGCPSTNSHRDSEPDTEYREMIMLKANDHQGLLKFYREKLKEKEDSGIRYKVAYYYYMLGDYESSLHFLAPLLNDSVSSDILNNAYLLKAKNMLDMGNRDEAFLLINKVISDEPENGEAQNVRGIILAELGDFDGAEKAFTIARKQLVDDEVVMNNLAMIEILRGNYQKAVDYLSPLYLRGVKTSKIIHNLLFALIKSGNYADADAILKKEHMDQTVDELIETLGNVQTVIKEVDSSDSNSINSNAISSAVIGSNDATSTTENNSNSGVNTNSSQMTETESNTTEDKAVIQPVAYNNSTQVQQSTASPLSSISSSGVDSVSASVATASMLSSTTSEKSEGTVGVNSSSELPMISSQSPIFKEDVGKVANNSSTDVSSASSYQNTDGNGNNLATVTGIRVGEHENSTRVVVESSKPIKYRLLESNEANQLRIEFENVNLNNVLKNTHSYLKSNNKTISNITFDASDEGNLVIIFHLRHKVEGKAFDLPADAKMNYRLVLDFYKA